MYAIPDSELENAGVGLADQYAVPQENLKFIGEWRAPEVGKTFLMFLITDPAHIQYGTTVTYAVGQGCAATAIALRISANA